MEMYRCSCDILRYQLRQRPPVNQVCLRGIPSNPNLGGCRWVETHIAAMLVNNVRKPTCWKYSKFRVFYPGALSNLCNTFLNEKHAKIYRQIWTDHRWNERNGICHRPTIH